MRARSGLDSHGGGVHHLFVLERFFQHNKKTSEQRIIHNLQVSIHRPLFASGRMLQTAGQLGDGTRFVT